MHNLLLNRKRTLPRVQAISCGEWGEWFVMFRDGTWRAGGHSNEARLTLAKVRDAGDDVIAVDFGSDGSFLVLHT